MRITYWHSTTSEFISQKLNELQLNCVFVRSKVCQFRFPSPYLFTIIKWSLSSKKVDPNNNFGLVTSASSFVVVLLKKATFVWYDPVWFARRSLKPCLPEPLQSKQEISLKSSFLLANFNNTTVYKGEKVKRHQGLKTSVSF